MKKFFYSLLSVMLLVTTMGCQIPTLELIDKNTSPFQRPVKPQNVKVVSGQPDRITISWDHQDDATGFIIYGTKIASINQGMLPMGRSRENVDTIDLLLSDADFEENQSYVFTVRAFKQFEGSSEILYSLDSDRIEGAFAPSRVDLNVALTPDSVKLYYNSPNLYSGLNPNMDMKALYGANFKIYFKDIIGDEGWKEPVDTLPDVIDYDNPELFKSLRINDQFIEGRRYLFKVIMEIPQPDGSIHAVESREVELIVSGDMLPTPIKDIVVTQGDSIDDIEVKWDIPLWTFKVSRDNSFFLIERSSDGGIKWEPIVDEISIRNGLEVSEEERAKYDENGHYIGITTTDDAKMQCKFVDTNVEKGKQYLYRITNSAENPDEVQTGKPEKGYYIQNEDPCISAPAYLYVPEFKNMTGNWNIVEDAEGKPTKANATFSWTLCNPFMGGVEPTWSLGVWKLNPGSNAVYDSIPMANVTYDVESNTFNFVDYEEIYEGNLYTQYYYTIVMNINGTPYHIADNLFEMKSDGIVLDKLILGKMIPVPDAVTFIKDMTASNDRLGKIVLNWTKNDLTEYTEEYTYQYKFENDDNYVDLDVTNPLGDGVSMEAEIPAGTDVTVEKKGRIFLKVASGINTYIPSEGLFYDVLHLPENLGIKAYYGNEGEYVLDWTGSDFLITDNVTYSYEVKNAGSSVGKVGIADINSGSQKIEGISLTSPKENMYEFNIVVENTKYPEEKIVSEKSTYLLPLIENISAAKGISKENIVVSWDDCGISGASYKVYRYEDEIGNMTYLGSSETNSYTDVIAVEDYGKSYFYTVSVVMNGKEGRIQTVFKTGKNPLGNDEPMNLGYVFGPRTFEPVVNIQQLEDGSLKPYFTVEFIPDRFISSYKISGDPTDKAYIFNMADISTVVDGLRTNGKDKEDIGFVSYDPAENKIVFNVAFNVLDDDFKIPNITVEGINGSVSEIVELKDVNARRALAALDYANIFNEDLKKLIAKADKAFHTDWWGNDDGATWLPPYDGSTGNQQVYEGKNVTVKNCHAANMSPNAQPGSIIFNKYTYLADRDEKGEIKNRNDKDGIAEYDTQAKITLMSTNGSSGSGYIGYDPLNIIGITKDGNSTSMKILMQHDINGNPVKYADAVISIDNIEKWNEKDAVFRWSGAYVVSINGGPSVRVSITDEYIKNKPY